MVEDVDLARAVRRKGAELILGSVPLRLKLAVAAATWFAALSLPGDSANAFELITAVEASLPSIPAPVLELRGSPTRRPHIEVVSPPPGAGLMYSPIALKLRFEAFGGAKINPDSVLITYLKQPSVDLTQRLKPFITAGGIDIAQADVPPGIHQLWIELKDQQGHVGGGPLTFQIAK
jgi:hypothetical protein